MLRHIFLRVSASPRLRVPASALLLVLCALFVACRATPTPSHPAVLIRLGAADSTQLLARDLATAFHQAHSYATVQVSVSNSSTVLRDLSTGTVDLALVSRSPLAEELANPAARSVEVARDGIVVVVNPANPVTQLSRDQVTKVFAGDFLKWSEITGQAAATDDSILVLSREEGSGTRTVFEQEVMAGRRVTLTALIETSEADILSYIAANPNAVGYISFNTWKDGTQTRALAVDNIAPSLATIQSASYPLMRSFYLVVPSVPNPDLGDFVNLVQSPAARTLITRRMAAP